MSYRKKCTKKERFACYILIGNDILKLLIGRNINKDLAKGAVLPITIRTSNTFAVNQIAAAHPFGSLQQSCKFLGWRNRHHVLLYERSQTS
jgi:hypothetical protein